jgi:HNH endonuclease
MMKNRYEIRGDTTVIFIEYKGKVYETYIDTEDLPKVMKYSIHLLPKKRKDGTIKGYYAKCSNNVYLHRLIKDCPKGMTVDHLDGNGLNNRKSNLEICTMARNNQNKSVQRNNKSSRERGITFNKNCPNNPWEAKIVKDKKVVYRAYFPTEEEAIQAIRKKRKEIYEYSRV